MISRTNAANSASEQTMESEILNNVPLQAETRNARPSDTTSIPNGSIDRITEPHRSSIPGGHLNSLETESQSASTDTYRSADIHKISTASTFSTSIFSQKAVQLIIPSSTSHTTASSSLIDLQDCLIDMVTSTLTGNYFATLVIKNVQQCLLLCGAVSGAVHITSAERSVIVVTARQFRMHDCRDCIVYLHANGQPIIENCHRVQFAPIPITFVSQDIMKIEARALTKDRIQRLKIS